MNLFILCISHNILFFPHSLLHFSLLLPVIIFPFFFLNLLLFLCSLLIPFSLPFFYLLYSLLLYSLPLSLFSSLSLYRYLFLCFLSHSPCKMLFLFLYSSNWWGGGRGATLQERCMPAVRTVIIKSSVEGSL